MLAAALGIAAVVPALGGSASAAAAPAVTLVGATGSGCPRTSVTASGDENGAIVVRYQQLAVAGTRQTQCTTLLRVGVPEGWTYAVPGTVWGGHAVLSADTTARLTTRTYYAGGAGPPAVRTGVTGLVGPFRWEPQFAPDTLTFHPCDAKRDLAVAVGLEILGAAESRISVATLELSPHDLLWKRCPTR
ncbi:hypothetical protein GCM10010124_11320 [Pilimelia terevasa]|uniref:DUF4360 domain-containing protein n=2 Tax=Pilimelia terevasa TaxID=53372 RepID=A0A8J3BHQ7_9ACTN|nr:hypothetical protein GCM10010124_11320 [Pilimelia terevasa]